MFDYSMTYEKYYQQNWDRFELGPKPESPFDEPTEPCNEAELEVDRLDMRDKAIEVVKKLNLIRLDMDRINQLHNDTLTDLEYETHGSIFGVLKTLVEIYHASTGIVADARFIIDSMGG